MILLPPHPHTHTRRKKPRTFLFKIHIIFFPCSQFFSPTMIACQCLFLVSASFFSLLNLVCLYFMKILEGSSQRLGFCWFEWIAPKWGRKQNTYIHFNFLFQFKYEELRRELDNHEVSRKHGTVLLSLVGLCHQKLVRAWLPFSKKFIWPFLLGKKKHENQKTNEQKLVYLVSLAVPTISMEQFMPI